MKENFLNTLPKEFTRTHYQLITKKFRLSPSTADKNLAHFLEHQQVERIKHGEYILLIARKDPVQYVQFVQLCNMEEDGKPKTEVGKPKIELVILNLSKDARSQRKSARSAGNLFIPIM